MKNYFALCLIVAMFSIQCKKESALSHSVATYDSEDSNLPAYSEWGYNTFGAYYERELFLYDNSQVPAKFLMTNNQTSFVLYGNKSYRKMSLAFILPGFSPKNYTDLVSLNTVTMDLTKAGYTVVMKLDSTINDTLQVINGTLEFKRAQNLVVDKNPVEVILSGYFDIQAIVGGTPISISEGRFDLGIAKDNFYVY